eukprot:358746-Karenia_brevis.AAC.1
MKSGAQADDAPKHDCVSLLALRLMPKAKGPSEYHSLSSDTASGAKVRRDKASPISCVDDSDS